nr:MAG: ORF1 [Torque teno midi virus]
MPFWWGRRRKFWYGRRRYFKKRRFAKRKPRRRFTTRRNRKFTRRRKRRKRKVRRKKAKINIQQWQPDSIRKCKIKGFSCLVLGAEGRQFRCFTNNSDKYVPPKAAGGGGFGCEVINLKWLFSQYIAHNNIWTTSNQYLDLCRYTGCKIKLFRHPYIDFAIFYERQPPFELDKLTYTELQPQNILLRKKRKILLSRQAKPFGKPYITIRVRPPKQMITKWFFQQDFCKYALLKLCASACDFSYPDINPKAVSTVLTLYALDYAFYNNSNWGNASKAYVPYGTSQTAYFRPPPYDTKKQAQTINSNSLTAQEAISYEKGWFQPGLIGGALYVSAQAETSSYKPTLTGAQPLITLRYNPQADDGVGNEVYLCSIFSSHYDKPSVTESYHLNNLPLWMAFYGYWDFLQQTTQDKGIMETHFFVVKSKALKCITQPDKQSYYPLVDKEFINGKWPNDEYVTANDKTKWYLTCEHQRQSINNIVKSGPYVPKLDNIPYSNWQLNYQYTFFFKWGGPQTTDPPVEDPCTRKKYEVPDTLKQSLQISDPEKLVPESILHAWDFRRGIVTSTALKRMSENLPIDSSIQSDNSETPSKRRKVSKEIPHLKEKEDKIKRCLLSLCENPTCQETENLQQYIQQQQQQQQHLRKNILQLLTFLKKDQLHMQMQTGLME